MGFKTSSQTFFLPHTFHYSAKVKDCLQKSKELKRDVSSHLELLELLLGAGVEHVGRVRAGRSDLSALQPVLKATEVVQELTPETPGLLDPGDNRWIISLLKCALSMWKVN